MSGFLLIGLGASNIVPVLFRGAGAQRRCRPASPSRRSRLLATRAFWSVQRRLASSQNRQGFQLRSGCWRRLSVPSS